MEMTLGRKDLAPLLADLEHLAALEKASVQPDQVVNGHMKPAKPQKQRQVTGQESFGF
jgi:hypothetical protein